MDASLDHEEFHIVLLRWRHHEDTRDQTGLLLIQRIRKHRNDGRNVTSPTVCSIPKVLDLRYLILLIGHPELP